MSYIDIETMATTSLSSIRKKNPSVSLPVTPDDVTLNILGFARLEPTDPPDADVVVEDAPKKYTETIKTTVEVDSDLDGEPVFEEKQVTVIRFKQSWSTRSFSDSELLEQLEDAKAEKRVEINRSRDDAFASGLDYEINGQPDVVQARIADKVNLLGLRIEAQELQAGGTTDAVMPFRAGSNVEYALTPQQMIDLTNAALTHIQGIYRQSWQLKDAIDAAVTRDEVQAVEWEAP